MGEMSNARYMVVPVYYADQARIAAQSGSATVRLLMTQPPQDMDPTINAGLFVWLPFTLEAKNPELDDATVFTDYLASHWRVLGVAGSWAVLVSNSGAPSR